MEMRVRSLWVVLGCEDLVQFEFRQGSIWVLVRYPPVALRYFVFWRSFAAAWQCLALFQRCVVLSGVLPALMIPNSEQN